MATPIIVVHFGDQPYVSTCLRMTAKYNTNIYWIGDVRSKTPAARIPNVKWIDYRDLPLSPQALALQRRFVNYSTNSAEFEFMCFQRMFYAHSLLDALGCDTCFHLDSDCALLTDISALEFRASVAFSVYPDFGNPLRMAASVHNARLTRDYLQRFCTLAEDIYLTGIGFHLIADKINYHRKNQIPGGICDMTLHKLLSSGVQNLGEPLAGAVFDYRFGTGEGHELEQQYRMQDGRKLLAEKNGGIYIEDMRGPKYRLHSLHFQGPSKQFLRS